ncbi:MAG: MFS transporter [Fimbriiglobus sp.]
MTTSPTRVRYSMIAATTMVAIMLYLDRVCLSILSEQIKPLLGESTEEQKLRFADLTSAFFWTYALFQLPAGWLGDRFGARSILAAYFCLWSVCTGLIGFAESFPVFFLLRLGCGLFEAGAYPLAAGIVRIWIPARVRGLASGCVAVGGRLGGAVAPLLTLWLAATGPLGWRIPFFVYGMVGVFGAMVFWLWYRDSPRQHRLVNEEEQAIILEGRPASPRVTLGLPPIRAFLASRALWLNSFVQFMANFAWVFIITLFPDFLKERFNTPDQDRAFYQSLPLYAGIFGMLLGGWLSDLAVRRFGLRWGRGLPVAGSRLFVGGEYLSCLVVFDPLAIALMMCVVAFSTDMGVAPVWAWGQDVGGRNVGAVIGWANMWGNFGAGLAPILMIRIRQAYPDDIQLGWNTVFLVCAATQLLAALAALGIDARRPISGTS